MSLKNYFAKSLRIALETSRILKINNKLKTKFHQIHHLDEVSYINNLYSYKKSISNLYTKFHQNEKLEAYIPQVKNQVSKKELIDSNYNKEIEEQISSECLEQQILNDINKPVFLEEGVFDQTKLPSSARVIKIIVRKSKIIEKVYLLAEDKIMSIYL